MVVKIKNSYKIYIIKLREVDSKNNYKEDVSQHLLWHLFKEEMTLPDIQHSIRVINNALDKFKYYGHAYNGTLFDNKHEFVNFTLNKYYILDIKVV